uniref:FYVE-type domain-containing protein n=1 Tax=Hyaloperonospora arabidopsidis (strain Emoy2) TaxID=559515 RepID=M4BPV2_HYAAE
MLNRVLKEVKLPFPDAFFPEMTVSTPRSDEFHTTASHLLSETLDAEWTESTCHPTQQSDQWKIIGNRNGLQVYRERGFTKGDAVQVTAMGHVTGLLEDVLLGLYASTTGALKTQQAIMHKDYLDAAVLHVLEQDPYSEYDTGFSYRFEGLKWLACAPAGKMVHKRDLCWHEELGRTLDANGNKVGYLVMQSVQVNECPTFEAQGLTRSTASVCYIFRSLPQNRVAVYMRGRHAVGGKARSWSADPIMAELWLGVASALECATAKRLSTLVSIKDRILTNAHKTCAFCNSKLKMLKASQNCKICGKSVCERCRVAKMIYPSRNTSSFPCSYFFCRPCLSNTKEKLYGRSGARISLDQEDGSGPSGSNWSGSPRYAHTHSTGRSGLNTSSDPVALQRQRVPSSRHQAGLATKSSFRGHGMYPLTPTSYSSARSTVSSEPSMSLYSTLSTNSGGSPTNDNVNTAKRVPSMRGCQPSQPSGWSAKNPTAANISREQRTTSDSVRHMAYGNSYMLSQHAVIRPGNHSFNDSRYVGSQSVDSTYDIEGTGTYCGRGFLSDDSDMSDESSNEEDEHAISRKDRRRQMISIYDANESGVIELSRESDFTSDSLNEVEPVDVFENDKLKYINSFRSNDSGVAAVGSAGGVTSYSNGSNEQESLLERLIQINMAAEATYLMTKYNSSIRSDSIR